MPYPSKVFHAYVPRSCRTRLGAPFRKAWPRSTIPTRHLQSQSDVSKPLRLAIVGSGPAGFYAAARLLQRSQDARVDMYEKLPVPFGLVRYGVAPDHPEVKNCQQRFEEVASSPRFQFIGNAPVGSDIPLAVMRRHYDALLFSYGASQDRLLGVPGEELRGVQSARAFVGWYNGLPEFANMDPDLSAGHAVVIGNGNVALDVARVLLTEVDVLRRTDMADQALEGLSRSRVKKVTIAGRRGPMQAAFTIKEVRELVGLPNASFSNESTELLPSSAWIASLPKLEQRRYRYAKLLRQKPPASVKSKACSLLSLVSPVRFNSTDNGNHLSSLTFQRNQFLDASKKFDLDARIKPTNDSLDVDASLAFRSIGYKASPIPGLGHDLGIDFDANRGVMQNDGLGRALSIANIPGDLDPSIAQRVIRGCYCSGWIKTGPNGVIASTMNDAFTTADAILSDWEADADFLNGSRTRRSQGDIRGWETLKQDVNVDQPVSWQGWKAIDTIESTRGLLQAGRPRVKMKDIGEMLSAAGSAKVSHNQTSS